MLILEKVFAPRQIRALERLYDVLKSMMNPQFFSNVGKIVISSVIAFEMLGVILLDTSVTPRGEDLDLTGYELVFEDEFEGDSLDLSKWAFRANGARRAGFNHPDQVWVEDGNLYIRAEYIEDGEYGDGWYAGMIRTVDEFVRGYFEMTCICSKGGGFWSAFWLNSTGMSSAEVSNGGIGGAEIDIFEAFNYKKPYAFDHNSVSLNVHVGGYGDGLRSYSVGNYKANDIYNTYNTYGLKWTEDEYIFYINGVEADRTSFADGVSEVGEYIIISLELPNSFSEEPGFYTDFIVDSVRVYQIPDAS